MMFKHRIIILLFLGFFVSALSDRCLCQEQGDGLLDSLKRQYDQEGVESIISKLGELTPAVTEDTTVNAALFVNIAAYIFNGGDRKEAIRILENANATFPENAMIYNVLGQFYWYTDERSGCLRSFKKVLSIDSTQSVARRYLDLLLFIPDDFVPPESMLTAHLKIRPLKPADVELDYKAVMDSRAHLRGVFGPDDDWPPEDLTMEDDLRALKNHEIEHRRRAAFTYTVMSHNESECLGCVYILPVHLKQFDAQIYMWVTRKAYELGWDKELFDGIKKWISEEWPFDRVAYPGRDIDWNTWDEFEMY